MLRFFHSAAACVPNAGRTSPTGTHLYRRPSLPPPLLPASSLFPFQSSNPSPVCINRFPSVHLPSFCYIDHVVLVYSNHRINPSSKSLSRPIAIRIRNTAIHPTSYLVLRTLRLISPNHLNHVVAPRRARHQIYPLFEHNRICCAPDTSAQHWLCLCCCRPGQET